MNDRFPKNTVDAHPNARMRFELIFASALLGAGLFLLPAVIYGVGVLLLGPYGERGEGMSTFYGNFFGDLAAASSRAWLLALGPLILITAIRGVFIGRRSKNQDADDAPAAKKKLPKTAPGPTSRARTSRRVEPRIGNE